MQKFTKSALAGAVALAVAQTASAGTAPYFIPLTSGELVDIADGFKVPNDDGTFTQLRSVDERNQPWKAPGGITQIKLMDMEEVENSDDGQSIVRVDNGRNSSMFDMLAFDPTGRYVYIPHETAFGAGVSRYDRENDYSEILFMGDEGFR